MIDVVFLILVFFVVTTNPQDLLANFAIPLAGTQPPEPDKVVITPLPPIQVRVTARGYEINGARFSEREFGRRLHRLAAASTAPHVAISCGDDAGHGSFINALDACAEHGVSNVTFVKARR